MKNIIDRITAERDNALRCQKEKLGGKRFFAGQFKAYNTALKIIQEEVTNQQEIKDAYDIIRPLAEQLNVTSDEINAMFQKLKSDDGGKK